MDKKTLDLIRLDDKGQLAVQALDVITAIEEQKRELDRAQKAIRDKLMGIMGTNGIDNIKTDRITISMNKGSAGKTVEKFDLDAFLADFPGMRDAALLYTTVEETAPTAPSIRIMLKKAKEE